VSASGDPKLLADFCATFQDALFAQLFDRLDASWSRIDGTKPAEIAMAGGVAANGVLRERILAWGDARHVTVRVPEKRYCTDNAAMIAFAGLQRARDAADPRRVTARSRIA
jgi:N6-L-threonylcarbamoyladenine synthase